MSENSQLQFIWEAISSKVKDAISIFSYNTFFEPIKPIDLANRCLVLKCPSESTAQTIMNHHAEILREAIASCGLGVSGFKLVVDGSDVYTMDTADDNS